MNYSRVDKVHILASFFKVHYDSINRMLRREGININEFFEFLDQEKKIDRNKFYSFFKNEVVADLYWNKTFEDFGVQEDTTICLDWE